VSLSRRALCYLLIAVAAVVLFLAAGAAYLYFWPQAVEARVRQSVKQALEDTFQSNVELADLQIKLRPRVSVVGEGLTMHYHGRSDVPPLIQIDKFSLNVGFWRLLRPVKHIPVLRVENMVITIPPRDPTKPKQPHTSSNIPKELSSYVIDRLVCEHADIRFLPRQSGKVPLDWEIHTLTLTSVNGAVPFLFHGELTNGKPVGEITTDGQFGPWDADDPGSTPVSGTYKFTHAELTPLPGIGGILSSVGKYQGVLTELDVEGETDTPDFSLDAIGTPVPLHTEFFATVNGTNGDTQLHPVAALLMHSLIIADGSIMRVPNAPGGLISLEATVPNGRIQDFLKLATRSEKAILTGPVKLKAKVVIPPGKERMLDRLSLDGSFGVEGGNWSSAALREKLETLSRRAIGKPEEQDAGSAITNLAGNFFLKQGVLHFRKLTFRVEGADIDLAGTYTLRQGELDLAGHLALEAKLSQTLNGAKSFFVKAFDPFFEKKGAGTVLPIRITGTRENPVFGVSVFHKSFKKSVKASSTKPQ
jgi:AsmA-like C-terminal region